MLLVHVVAGGDVAVVFPQGEGLAGVRLEVHDGTSGDLGISMNTLPRTLKTSQSSPKELQLGSGKLLRVVGGSLVQSHRALFSST